jgi:hypothetical protein
VNWYRTSEENLSRIKEIVKKIIQGNKEWTSQELQIQQNHPKAIEELLKEHYGRYIA